MPEARGGLCGGIDVDAHPAAVEVVLRLVRDCSVVDLLLHEVVFRDEELRAPKVVPDDDDGGGLEPGLPLGPGDELPELLGGAADGGLEGGFVALYRGLELGAGFLVEPAVLEVRVGGERDEVEGLGAP